jgi:hypothetical protein
MGCGTILLKNLYISVALSLLMFKLFKKKFKIDEYEDEKTLQDEWIKHFYVIPMSTPDKESDLDELKEKILARTGLNALKLKVYSRFLSVDIIHAQDISQELNRIKDFLLMKGIQATYFIIIGFPNPQSLNEKDVPAFSPIESFKVKELMKGIEFDLTTLIKIQRHESITYMSGLDNELFIIESDGLQYHTYPLSKRAKLYSKYPELDKQLFGMEFMKFAQWIIDKEKDNEAMKRNAERVRKILNKIEK